MNDSQREVELLVPQVVITEPTAGQVMTSSKFFIRGNNGNIVVNAYEILPDGTRKPLGSSLTPNGNWAVEVVMLDGIRTVCVGLDSNMSEPRTFRVQPVFTIPNITHPAENDVVLDAKKVMLKGMNATPGYPVHIVRKWDGGEFTDLGDSLAAGRDGSWSKELDLRLWSGRVTLLVRHDAAGEGKWSQPRSFILKSELGVLTITQPDANTEQNQTFTLSGIGGRAGAKVEVYEDFGSDKLAESGTLTGSGWDVAVTVAPGQVSLVALQREGGNPSDRSLARLFNIRPAKLAVTVTPLANEQVRFSGAGYTGATVEITKISGPGAAVFLTVVVKDSLWEVTAKNWVPGSYTLSAKQKVLGKDGVWIPSEDYQFPFTWALPVPTEETYTKEYTPTFSGKGYTTATVAISNPGGGSPVAPDVVVRNGIWSSKASQQLGPMKDRKFDIKQGLNGFWSPTVTVVVTIPPLAPDITSIVDNGLSPTITGTCWPGAVVELTYSGSATKHKPTVTNGTWTFRRDDPFAHDVTHTVTVTQTAASQTSESASKTFTIPLPQLVITSPVPGQNEEVSRDLVVKGNNGVKGATVKIRDVLYNRDLGSSEPLSADGPWSVTPNEPLDFRQYSIDAIQTNSVRESVPSEVCTFKVVMLPPTFEVPLPGGDLPRVSIISGKGLPDARVSVWRQGHDAPLLREVLVDKDGHWKGRVELFLVREIVILATQTFGQQTSEDSPLLTCNVVPNAPDMETPAAGEFVQNKVMCAGFGYTDNTGDMVTVALADDPQTVLGQTQVLADRSWSMQITLARPGGNHKLIAVQSRDGFTSAPSPERLIRLGSFQPQVNEPAEGRWVTEPVACEGEGQNGVGKVVAWFDPELELAGDIPSTEAGWQATIKEKLRPGGHRVCFQQRLEEGTVLSRWAESPRFEVAPPKPPSE
ncbi:hypothetical protein [Pseudomonas fluorescens]|uniref:hypothetical protein n=1 Tax=Pseudomonas fluorescens TaxID=294 RepID=UPI003D0240F5